MLLFLLFIVVSSGITQCGFTNYNFTDPLSVGWTIDQANPLPHIDENNHLVLGDVTTETPGNSSVYQDFTITSCNQNLTLIYGACTKDFSYMDDQQSLLIKNPSTNETLVPLFNTLLGFNVPVISQWFTFHCNVCDGTCGGSNLTSLGPLRLELSVHQNGNGRPTAMIIKEICLE